MEGKCEIPSVRESLSFPVELKAGMEQTDFCCVTPQTRRFEPNEGRFGSKTAVTWGCVRAFQQISSTPMNGLEMTLAPFKIWLCATEQRMARGLTPPAWRMWAEHRPYSIASSARPTSERGKVTPRVLAALRLIISSTLVTCWTGRSAGLSPLSIRPVWMPA